MQFNYNSGTFLAQLLYLLTAKFNFSFMISFFVLFGNKTKLWPSSYLLHSRREINCKKKKLRLRPQIVDSCYDFSFLFFLLYFLFSIFVFLLAKSKATTTMDFQQKKNIKENENQQVKLKTFLKLKTNLFPTVRTPLLFLII